MKYLTPFLLVSLEVFGKCVSLPSPFKTKVKIIHIEKFASSSKETKCGVELEIGAGEVGWLKVGEKANFWADSAKICNLAPGAVTAVTLMHDCCDANYDWCVQEWKTGEITKTAQGNRIISPK